MTSSTRSRFVSVAAFAISGISAACMSVALATLLAANPKGPDATGQAAALLACAAMTGTCLTLAAGAGVDDD